MTPTKPATNAPTITTSTPPPRRTVCVKTWLTQREKDILDSKTSSLSVSISDWLRKAILVWEPEFISRADVKTISISLPKDAIYDSEFTTSEISLLANISMPTMRKLENGGYIPDQETIQKLSVALDTPLYSRKTMKRFKREGQDF